MQKPMTKEEVKIMEKTIGVSILLAAFTTGSIIGAVVYHFLKK